jgi:cardiolipin synthase
MLTKQTVLCTAFLFSTGTLFAAQPGSMAQTASVNFDGDWAYAINIPAPDAPNPTAPVIAAGASSASIQTGAWANYFQKLAPLMKNDGLYDAGTDNLALLVDGPQVIGSVVPDVKNAREFIDIEVFAWEDNDIGAQFRDLLAQKVKEGLKVRVILDQMGSDLINPLGAARKFADSMQKDGIDVKVRPAEPLHLDHRKVMVMDDAKGGLVAYTGGMNIGDNYQRNWHDQQTRVLGPAINRLHQSFIDDWATLTGEHLSGFPSIAPEDGARTYVITHVGGDSDQNIKQAYLLAINTARSLIRIEDPYFTDDDVIAALIKAAQAKVRVQLIVPAQDNKQVTLSAFRSHYPDMLKAGVEVYEYQPRMEHMKVSVMDHLWATVGSSNLDPESLKYNNEMNLLVLDPAFASQMDTRIFDKDIPQSVRIAPGYKPSAADDADGHLPFLAPEPVTLK